MASTTPPPVTELVLVRHGETEWNIVKRLQGHTDTRLSAFGGLSPRSSSSSSSSSRD